MTDFNLRNWVKYDGHIALITDVDDGAMTVSISVITGVDIVNKSVACSQLMPIPLWNEGLKMINEPLRRPVILVYEHENCRIELWPNGYYSVLKNSLEVDKGVDLHNLHELQNLVRKHTNRMFI